MATKKAKTYEPETLTERYVKVLEWYAKESNRQHVLYTKAISEISKEYNRRMAEIKSDAKAIAKDNPPVS